MDIQIRTDKLLNNSMAAMNQEAFHAENTSGECGIESLRAELSMQPGNCDPSLSLLAEIAGEGSGHVLYSIYQFTVAGMAQQSALLASVFIYPGRWRKENKIPFVTPKLLWIPSSKAEKAA